MTSDSPPRVARHREGVALVREAVGVDGPAEVVEGRSAEDGGLHPGELEGALVGRVAGRELLPEARREAAERLASRERDRPRGVVLGEEREERRHPHVHVVVLEDVPPDVRLAVQDPAHRLLAAAARALAPVVLVRAIGELEERQGAVAAGRPLQGAPVHALDDAAVEAPVPRPVAAPDEVRLEVTLAAEHVKELGHEGAPGRGGPVEALVEIVVGPAPLLVLGVFRRRQHVDGHLVRPEAADGQRHLRQALVDLLVLLRGDLRRAVVHGLGGARHGHQGDGEAPPPRRGEAHRGGAGGRGCSRLNYLP